MPNNILGKNEGLNKRVMSKFLRVWNPGVSAKKKGCSCVVQVTAYRQLIAPKCAQSEAPSAQCLVLICPQALSFSEKVSLLETAELDW